MTKIVTVHLVDNFDNTIEATNTVTFVFDGRAYTLDLCDKNAERYREAFRPFVEVADCVGSASVTVDGELIVPATVGRRRAVPFQQPARPIETATVVTDALVEAGSRQTELDLADQADSPETEPRRARPTRARQPERPAEQGAKLPRQSQPAMPEDGYPPNKSWLRYTTQVATNDELRAQGRAFRNAMRVWARTHGWPNLKDTGKIPQELVDAYWAFIERFRGEPSDVAESA